MVLMVLHSRLLILLDIQPIPLFFSSSRRRHTRWNCDWSSDVCSSDLAHGTHRAGGAVLLVVGVEDEQDLERPLQRSEERRVGKECRARGSPDDYNDTINPDIHEVPKHLFQDSLNNYNKYFEAPYRPDR